MGVHSNPEDTSMENHPVHVDLNADEVRILVQSLGHCLATCEIKKKTPDAFCPDCDAARALQTKLQATLPA